MQGLRMQLFSLLINLLILLSINLIACCAQSTVQIPERILNKEMQQVLTVEKL